MPRPNLDRKFKDIGVDSMLFECICHGEHYLEVFLEEDDIDITFAFKDYPNSLWSTLKWWWIGRGLWRSEIILNINDIEALRDRLSEFLISQREKDLKL